MSFKSENDNNEETLIGNIQGVFVDVTNGQESGEIRFQTMNNGAESTTATVTSTGIDVASGGSYSINGSPVLSSTELHSSVIKSALTSVGELTSLTVAAH